MHVTDIIYNTCSSRPEGRGLLNSIKINMKDIESQYHACDMFKRVVDIKFDMNKLANEGYTLQEILDLGSGVICDETERFVLKKLQEYIRSKK
jgi:hypothetical protein